MRRRVCLWALLVLSGLGLAQAGVWEVSTPATRAEGWVILFFSNRDHNSEVLVKAELVAVEYGPGGREYRFPTQTSTVQAATANPVTQVTATVGTRAVKWNLRDCGFERIAYLKTRITVTGDFSPSSTRPFTWVYLLLGTEAQIFHAFDHRQFMRTGS